jgi:phage terminase large subunit-like protein
VWRFWLPEAALGQLEQATGGQAAGWAHDGWLTITQGNVLDYQAIRLQLAAEAARWEIRELGYDPWNATEFVEQRLGEADGFRVVPVRQGFASLSPPSKELERMVLAHQLQHGGNPVARWCMDNVVVKRDPAGNIEPDKLRSGEKIDGVVALITRLDRAIRSEPVRRSAYEDAEVVVA